MKATGNTPRCHIALAVPATPIGAKHAGPTHVPQRRGRRRNNNVIVPRALNAFADKSAVLDGAIDLVPSDPYSMDARKVLTCLLNLEHCVQELTKLRDQIRNHVVPRLMSLRPILTSEEELLAVCPPAAGEVALIPLKTVPRVLHIDTDYDGAATLAALLTPEARVTHVTTVEQARILLRQERYSLVVMDPQLPDGDGAMLLPDIGATPLLVHTVEHAPWHVRAGGYIVKPYTSQRQIWQTVARMLGIGPDLHGGD